MTSEEIRELLREEYNPPEWAIAFEVGDATGFKCRRHADAVAMSLYPSRGLGIYGFEIKVSRTDLIKELELPDKAESIAQFCSGWSLVYPSDIKDSDLEIPIGWGIKKVKDGKLRTVRASQPLVPQPPTIHFMAALFRGMCKEDEFRLSRAVQKRTVEILKTAEADAEYEVKRRITKSEEISEAAKEVLDATGINLFEGSWRTKEIIRAITQALHYKEPPIWKIKNIEGILRDAANKLAQGINEITETK